MILRTVTALLLACTAAGAAAQSLNGPESIEFHPRSGRYFISNTAGGIQQRAPDGTLSLFTDAPTSPYGIELLGGVLYVLDSGHLKGYDVDSVEPVLDLAIAGASFLNGITSDGAHTIYLSDFGARKIHRVDVADLAAPTQSVLTPTAQTPNGLAYDRAGNRLLVATWTSNAKILEIPLDGTPTPATLIQTQLGNIDGITLDCHGAIVVAPWSCGSGGCLRRFDPPFALDSPAQVLADGLSNPADIDYNRLSGEIAVPESGANQVSFHPTGCEAAVFADDFER
ncbi:SMP-30/gluconolactonase/LRE family protein [Dokdonella sp.]|uniref:SMP-30/gluconolactonase/LRE family protein n=1 Tax=Dokdonella sp. TaxID=2291710 RepID=UPI001B102448|nr:SMP-30/gluconolactonase/LRE family protein [Dokdonella sp.]MBO9663716.1 SMP-30/gluconolactonase/LRE family protein [Dokdonella sp.]